MMKRILSIFMLLLVVSMGAWADVTPYSQDYEGDGATCDWESGNTGRYTTALAESEGNHYVQVSAVGNGNSGALIKGNSTNGKAKSGDNYTLIFDLMITGGNNQASWFQVNDANNTNTNINGSADASKCVLLLQQTAASAATWKINGNETQIVTLSKTEWNRIKLTVNDGKTYLTVTDVSTGNDVLARTVITTNSETLGLGGIQFATKRYYAGMAIDNVVVREVEDGDLPNETYYTATFTDNTTSTDVTSGTTIYTDAERTTLIANGMLLDGQTYYYTATQKAYENYEGSFTVSAADPAINFSMTAQPTYSYTVNAVDGSSNVLATLASGSSYNTASVSYAYPQFILANGVLYTKDATSQVFGTSFTLSSNEQVENVVYSTSSYADAVYYAEAESIEGMTASNSGQGDARCSNRYGAYAGEDVNFVTLPAGTYKIHAAFCGSTGTTFAIKAGETTVWSAETTGSRGEKDGENFTVDGTTPLTIAKAGSGNVLLDNIIIQQVTPASYEVAIADGIENGTVEVSAAEAKAGDEVTITATPAEGYELASISVTGQTSNLAVEVTDGKFIMPADAVTVSAKFVLPTPPSYDITVAEGIVGGTVEVSSTSAKAGVEVTITATPAEGYELASVTVVGASEEPVEVTDGKFTMPAEAVTVSATFVLPTPPSYDITVAESIVGGTVEVSSTSAKAGEEVTITATPAEGYELASISVTGQTSNLAVIVTDGKFTMPEDAVTVSATFKKKAIYIETDLTSQFSSLTESAKWTGATGYAEWAAPKVKTNTGAEVFVCENFVGTCENTGDVFYQTVTGLAPGTYKIELYGAAAYTGGRDGFASSVFSQNNDAEEPKTTDTGVTLYAETSEGRVSQEIPLNKATSFASVATAVLENVIVGANGEVKIGMNKTSQATNWHVVQLKGVTAQVDAIELHATTLASAQAALSAEENAVVVGEEKTALETAIANNSEVAEQTAEAYKTAIEALETAKSAFTSARGAYAALASTKESLVEYEKKYVYASAEKTAAVTAAAEAAPTSAADATSKNVNLINALRAMAESHANAEGVEGAEAIAITNPSAEDNTNGWTTVNGEGSEGSIGIRDNEPWTSADGSTAHKYFDGGNWGASAWDVSLTQNVELAAGKYMLSAIGRASGDVALTLFAGESKTTMPSIGAAGGLFDRGWNISSVEFEVEAKSAVTIGVQGVTSVIHNWMSFSDFKLVLIESHAIKDAKAELLEAINEAKAIDTEYKDGAEELAAAITVAEGVYNNQDATVEGVNTAKSDLAAAVAAFNAANAKYSELTYTITGQSSIKATIKKGKAVLDIIPEEGWAVAELTVNDEDALEQLADNKLVVNVDADATLVEVTFGWADAENMYEEDDVTGIATIADEGIKVYAQDNQICVEGAAGKVVRVYTLYGSLLKAATPSENKVAKFSVAAGTYVVQVGNKAAKISVK